MTFFILSYIIFYYCLLYTSDKVIYKAADDKKPFLGICLGMQMIFDKSYEYGEFDGLGLIKGEIKLLPDNVKKPHIGWNNLNIKMCSPLFEGLPESPYVYLSLIHISYVDFSGRGYTRNIVYVKPDIAAPAYNVPAPLVGGGVDLFTGTSFAAPHAAGVAALIMQWGIVLGNDLFMYGEKLKAYLQRGAVRYANSEYPNPRLGYGKLCFCLLYTSRCV